MDLVAGTVVAGRFRLVRELGHGGMGSVWLAQDTSLETPCAIKFIIGSAAEDPQMRARFEREAKSAAQLRSPNVVQILDHGISDGVPYIAMELLEGEDLDHRLQRVGRLGPHETVYIMTQVAKALTRASAAGLVHRDLKPANIFLVRDEDRDIPKVLDFGVAKSTMPDLADSSTKTGALMGTPFYMSPEQTRGTRALDHRSDLWALGVIVFQCVTGRLPFISESLGDLLFKIAIDAIPVPSQVAPDVPVSFDAWWARASQRDPAHRYQTAKDFVEALSLSFGMAQSGGFAASGGSGGSAYHGSGSPSGAGSSPSWGGSQSNPAIGQSAVGQSAAGVIGGLPIGAAPVTQAGVTSNSVAEKVAPKRGGAGVILGVVGAIAVAGAVGYGVVVRGSKAAPPPTPSVVAASPEVSSAPSTTTAPPVVVPTGAVSVAQPPPVDTSSAPKPTKTVPGVKTKPSATPSATPSAPPQTPTKIVPNVPNDGI